MFRCLFPKPHDDEKDELRTKIQHLEDDLASAYRTNVNNKEFLEVLTAQYIRAVHKMAAQAEDIRRLERRP